MPPRAHPREQPLAYAPTGDLYLGSKIRALRQEQGWSLTYLATVVGCQPSALSLIETNKVRPAPHLVAALAMALTVPLADLEQAPMPPALESKRTASRRAALPPAAHGQAAPPLSVADDAAPTPAAPPAAVVPAPCGELAPPWTFGDQVTAIIDTFRLSPVEQQFVRELVVDITRTLCLRIKDGASATNGLLPHQTEP